MLTVPASFDEVARELTVEAAREAGLDRVRLIEEPQAAFYDFLHHHEQSLVDALGGARLVLVVDVGGGTTDLTLVRATPRPTGPPSFERIAVGDHLMLGGDNMDAALARHVEEALTGQVGELAAARWSALVHASRLAKETLLSGEGPESYGVAMVGRGSRLIGGSLSLDLAKADAERILLDGFLPRTAATDEPIRRGRVALSELSLPFASDPGISRHVAAFLRRHREACEASGVDVIDGLPRPDAVLLNGGVFNAPAVVERMTQVLAGWFPGEPVRLLEHRSLELAVARGAAYYGLVRRGLGLRIGGGSARAYYVGVEGEGAARHAFCVVPRGMEEGAEYEIPERTFRLRVGQPVSFPLFTSTDDRVDALGDLVDVDEELEPLPPLATVLEAEGADGEAEVPVQLSSALTEIGTLELALATTEGEKRRWRLGFALRGAAGGGAAVAPIEELPKRFDEARELVERCFGKKSKDVDPKEIKRLRKTIEKVIGPRNDWTSAVNRELWTVVFGGASKRRRTPVHERVWFQLVGFCLRPGFGAPLDEWRIDELWKSFDQGVQHATEKNNWSEWWILWRRVSGGLDAERQYHVYRALEPWLAPARGRRRKARGPKAEGHEEMERLAASLERLPADEKATVGEWILHRRRGTERSASLSWWPLGRIGARQPLYGSAHDVVAIEVAESWIERLLELDWSKVEGAAFAAAQIARATGDRHRDLPEETRQAVARRLAKARAADSWARMVREVTELDAQDEMRVFGDSLPPGLRLA